MGIKNFFKSLIGKDDDEEEFNDDYENDNVIDEDASYGIEDSSDTEYIPVEKNKSVSKYIGLPSQVEMTSPAAISIDNDSSPDTVLVSENGAARSYYQPYYIPPAGYPKQVSTETLLNIIAAGYIDMTIDVLPIENAVAQRDLKRMQTVIEGNVMYQQEKGLNFQMRDNLIKTQSIDNILDGISHQTNRTFYTTITFLVYGKDPNELRAHCDEFTSEMSNEGFTVQKMVNRVKSGLLRTIPLGIQTDTLDDAARLIDTHGLSKLDPAQNGGADFNEGIPMAINRQDSQQRMFYLNVFGTEEKAPINYNMGIVGSSGAGKSYFVKVKTYREVAVLNYQVRSIDPQGEYVPLTKALPRQDAVNLNFSADSDLRLNPCRLSISEKPIDVIKDPNSGNDLFDDDAKIIRNMIINKKLKKTQLVNHDGQTYIRYVPIKSKVNQIIDFIKQIYAADYDKNLTMQPEEKNILTDAILKSFEELGITSDPDSLYTGRAGERNGVNYENLPKREPTLSDIDRIIRRDYYNNEENKSKVQRLLSVLSQYLETGTIPIFDGQTFFGPDISTDLARYRYVNFNISELDGSFKEIAAYVIAQTNWHNWITNPMYAKERKVLIMDEILEQIKNPIFGNFAELAVRQARKFNASITWLAQDLGQLKNSDQFRALISNSNFFFFTHIREAERKIVQNLFNLDDGIMNKLTAHIDDGEGILMDDDQNTWVKTWSTPVEQEFAESNPAKLHAQRKKMEDSIDEINKKYDKDHKIGEI